MERIRIRRRIHGKLTPAQQRRLERTRALIARELPDLIHRNQLAHDARKENTLSGAIRRAVHEFPLSSMKIAARAGIEWIDLDGFLTGEKPLPSDAMDRLVKVLKLKLPPMNLRTKSRTAKAS